MSEVPAKPRPCPTPTAQPFWDGLRGEKLMLQRSASTGGWCYYPRLRAPGTLADDLEWCQASGSGEIYTYTVARKPTGAPWSGETPQILAIVELDEGPRVPTRLVDVDEQDVRIGLRVSARFEHGDDGITLLAFGPE